MKKLFIRCLAVFLSLIVLTIFLQGCGGTDAPPPSVRPVVFVHGGSGSASQFESMAQRLMINGYPLSYLSAYEHHTGTGAPTLQEQGVILGGVIDAALAKTGADKVDLIAHSRGAGVCAYYLEGSPANAAKVANYVAVDSQTGLDVIKALGLTRTPGNVRMLALWGEGDQTRAVVGATNVYIPTLAHIEACTSAVAFVEYFKFFNGRDPATTAILPEGGAQVTIQGKAFYFPENVGALGTLNIYEVSPNTGFRVSEVAVYNKVIGADGDWGPVSVKRDAPYEFAFAHATTGEKHYFYREPFWRSNYFVRLNTSRPGTGLGAILTRTDKHVDILISRDMEIWGNQGAGNDVLIVDGTNVATAQSAPRTKRLSGLFLLDWGPTPTSFPGKADEKTDLSAPISVFHAQSFMSGLDLYIPASLTPNRTIPIWLIPRGGGGKTQVINIPNWASSQVRVTVFFKDYVQ